MGRSRFRRSYIELGKDGAGQDLIAHGDTAGAYLWWDASANKLKFMGGADMDFGSFGTPLVVNQDNNYTLGIFGEVSVANSEGTNVERSIWSRLEVSAAQTGAFSIFGGQLQLRWSDGCATLGSGVENAQYGGAWLYLEQDTTGQALADYAHASGAVVQVETFGSLTIPTNAHLSGLQIESRLGAANGAAITNNSGTIAGLFITKSPAASGVTAQNWPYGIFIEDCDIGIHLESTQKIQFLDAGIFIHASVDGKLLISSDGDGADDITLSGTVTIGDSAAITLADPTAEKFGFEATINAAGGTGWTTGTVAPVRSQLNIAVTAGGSYGTGAAGWFGLEYSTALAGDGVGLTAGVYVTVDNKIAGKAPCSVLYLEDEVSSNGVNTGMPILVLTSKGNNDKTSRIAIEFGFGPAGTKVSYGTSEYTYYQETIRVKVNGSIRYLPLSTAEGSYTTAYPIVSTHGGGDATANAFTSTITDPTIDGAGETSYGFSGTINAGGVTGWSGGQVCPVFGQLNVDARSPGDYGTGAGGWFELTYAATLTADGIGLTAGAYVKVSSACALKAPTAVLYLEDENTDSGDTSTMPILVLASKGTEAQKSKIAIAFGFVPAGAPVGNDSGMIYYNETIRVTANGSVRFIPLSTEEGTYTTAFPILSTYAGEALSIDSTLTGSDHIKIVDINVTDETIENSGYNALFFLEDTCTGAKTSTEYSAARFNLLLNTGEQTGIMNALKAKVGTGDVPTLTSANVNGIMVSMDEIGQCSSLNCMWLEMYTSTTGSSSYISMRSQATAQVENLFRHYGNNKPTYFLKDQTGAANGFWDLIASSDSDVLGHIKILMGGTTGYINVYVSTS